VARKAGFLEPLAGGAHSADLGVTRGIVLLAHGVESTQNQATGVGLNHRGTERRLRLGAQTGSGEFDERLHLRQIRLT
jgi:hypothetical protein